MSEQVTEQRKGEPLAKYRERLQNEKLAELIAKPIYIMEEFAESRSDPMYPRVVGKLDDPR